MSLKLSLDWERERERVHYYLLFVTPIYLF